MGWILGASFARRLPKRIAPQLTLGGGGGGGSRTVEDLVIGSGALFMHYMVKWWRWALGGRGACPTICP